MDFDAQLEEKIRKLRASSKNSVERAVWLAGGPSAVARLCGVNWHTVYKWRKRGIVETARCAVLLSDATDGRVSVRQLAGPLQRSA